MLFASLQIVTDLDPATGPNVVRRLMLVFDCRTPANNFILGVLTRLNDGARLKRLYDTYDDLQKKLRDPNVSIVTMDYIDFDA